MIEVEIENRQVNDETMVVDLIVDGETISTGDDPITSYSFWKDIEDQTQRALFRIKTKHPKMKFDFDLATMMLSEEQKEARFVAFLKKQHPNLDVEKVDAIIKANVGKIELTGQDDNHPNPYLVMPIGSQFIRNFIMTIIEDLLKSE